MPAQHYLSSFQKVRASGPATTRRSSCCLVCGYVVSLATAPEHFPLSKLRLLQYIVAHGVFTRFAGTSYALGRLGNSSARQ